MRIQARAEDARRLAAMPPDELRAWLAKCRPQELLLLDAAFEMWAAEGQIAPTADGWRVWLMMAGRGFGKTRAGAEWIHQLAMSGARRIALVGASIDEARSVMVEGVSGILSISRRYRTKVKWEPSLGKLTWPKGSVAQLFSGDHPDGLRGAEHHFAWADELAKWRRVEESWANLEMGLRAGTRARVLVTTTPRPLKLLERLKGDKRTVTTGGRTSDNLSLPRSFIEAMADNFGGSRLGRQELDGELLSEAEGSLFPRELLERARVQPLSLSTCRECFDRVVVGVDPCVSADGDACGIVVAGRRDEQLFVLVDRSVERATPDRWARAVALAAAEWGASHVVAEANQGGAMVESVLTAADAGLKIRLVHASRGKVARAEPVAVRFETGQAFLAGEFPELEAELSGFTMHGYVGSGSPDRADAMVWALTELGNMRNGMPRVRML